MQIRIRKEPFDLNQKRRRSLMKNSHSVSFSARMIEATLSQERGLFSKALSIYRQLLSSQKEIKNSHIIEFNMALCFEKLQLQDEAISIYEQIIRHRPMFQPAIINLYSVLLRLHRIDEARNVESMGIVECCKASRYNYALSLYKVKQLQQSQKEFNNILASSGYPKHKDTVFQAKCLIMLGKIAQRISKRRAVNYFLQAQRIHPSPKLELHIRLMDMEDAEVDKENHKIQDKKRIRKVILKSPLSLYKQPKINLDDLACNEAKATFSTRCPDIITTRETFCGIPAKILEEEQDDAAPLEFFGGIDSISLTIRKPAKVQILVIDQDFVLQEQTEVEGNRTTEFLQKEQPPTQNTNNSQDQKTQAQPTIEQKIQNQTQQVDEIIEGEDNQDIVDRTDNQQTNLPDISTETGCEDQKKQEIPATASPARRFTAASYSPKMQQILETVEPNQSQSEESNQQQPQTSMLHPLLLEAQKSYARGQFKTSILCLKSLITEDNPVKLEALALMSDAYESLKVPEKAAIYQKKLLELDNQETYFHLERLYCQAGKHEKAIQILKKGLNKHIKNPQFFQRIGWLSLTRNNIEEARDYLEKAYSLSCTSKSIRNKLIHVYSLGEDTTDKCKALLTELNEEDLQDQNLKIVIAYFIEREFSGEKRIEMLRKLYPDQQHYIFKLFLGRCLIEQGKPREGLEHMRQSAETNNHNTKALYEIACLLLSHNELALSQEIFTKILQIDPDDYDALSGLANIAKENKQFQQALDQFVKVFKFQPWNFMIANNIAECYGQLKKPQNSVKFYKKSLKINKNQPDVMIQIGHLLQLIGQPQNALQYYNESDKFNAQFQYQRAIGKADCHILLSQFDQAEKILDEICRRRPIDNHVRVAYATCSYFKGDYDAAIELYSAALTEDTSEKCAFNLAVCYHRVRDFNNSKMYYEHALTLNCKNAQAFFNLGVLHAESGQYDEAVDNIRKAVQIKPHLEEWVAYFMQILVLNGNYKEAEHQANILLQSPESYLREKGMFMLTKINISKNKSKSNILLKTFTKLYPDSRYVGTLNDAAEDSSESLVSLALGLEEQTPPE